MICHMHTNKTSHKHKCMVSGLYTPHLMVQLAYQLILASSVSQCQCFLLITTLFANHSCDTKNVSSLFVSLHRLTDIQRSAWAGRYEVGLCQADGQLIFPSRGRIRVPLPPAPLDEDLFSPPAQALVSPFCMPSRAVKQATTRVIKCSGLRQ